VKLLLDTHVFLWWREDSDRLDSHVKRTIGRGEVVYVSAASAWEIAIKIQLGKLRIPGPVEAAVEESRFSKLPVTFAHAAATLDLPEHHRDPFDRILIAQARVEGLSIVTADRKFEPYGAPVVWT
jgi:PIN domain nuclease of toxin-antitoxin system